MTRAKQQSVEIQRALMSGADPRSIPALVDRITTQLATQAFAYKGDAYYMTFPDMERAQIRTTASAGVTGRDVSVHTPININVDRFDPNIKAAFGINGTQAVNFMNFDMEDGRMLIDGVSAHLYHHALGTFDLDDKALNLPLMFKDANGKSRLAFMTMRQPTGFQERIFSKTDFAKKENIANMLKTRSSDYLDLFESLQDPLNTMNLNADEREILDQIRQSILDLKGDKKLRGKIQVRGVDVDTADVEDLLIRVRNSQEAKSLKFESFMEIQEFDLAEMASGKSASQLGLNKRIFDQARAQNVNLAQLYERMGLKIGAEPFYSRGKVFNIMLDQTGLNIDQKFAEVFSEISGMNFATRADVRNYIADPTLSAEEKRIAEINRDAAMQRTLNEVSISSVPDPSNSLGLYINRQGVAVSMQNQVDDVLNSFGGKKIAVFDNQGAAVLDKAGGQLMLDIGDYYALKYSVGLIPPSNAVDLVKELVANSDNPTAAMNQVKQLVAARLIDQAAMEEVVKGVQAYFSFADMQDADATRLIGELFGNYGQINPNDLKLYMNLGTAGEGAIKNTAEGIGFLRAQQILRGDAFEDLVAFDPALLEKGGLGQRIKTDEELIKIQQSVLKSYQAALDQTAPGTAGYARLQAEFTRVEQLSGAALVSGLSLVKGSKMYEKYAATSRYLEAAKKEKDILEGSFSQMYRAAKNASDPFAPVPKAEYLTYTDAIAESLRDDFDYIRALDADQAYSKIAETYLKSETTQGLSTKIYNMMSALASEKSANNILDVFDTMESSIRRKYGARAAQVMRESIYKEGAPEDMRI
jgi:hypothetical protein